MLPQEIQEKDIISLTRALKQVRRKAYRLALRITQNHADAEDVLQESLLKAYLKLSQFRGDSCLSTWLATIVTHEAITILRRRFSRREVSLDDGIDTDDDHFVPMVAVDPGESPEASAMREEFRALFAVSIEKLELKFRIVFVMREMGEFSIEEMARVLELSISAVKTRLFKARRSLTGHLLRRIGKAGGLLRPSPQPE